MENNLEVELIIKFTEYNKILQTLHTELSRFELGFVTIMNRFTWKGTKAIINKDTKRDLFLDYEEIINAEKTFINDAKGKYKDIVEKIMNEVKHLQVDLDVFIINVNEVVYALEYPIRDVVLNKILFNELNNEISFILYDNNVRYSLIPHDDVERLILLQLSENKQKEIIDILDQRIAKLNDSIQTIKKAYYDIQNISIISKLEGI